MFFTHDPWTRDASGMPERFAEELSPRKKIGNCRPQGNGNCEAGSETGMSYEFMHRAHRASTEGARWVGVLEYGAPPVVYRGG